MMRWISFGWIWSITAIGAEPVRSGHATAEWVAESATVPAGHVLRTAVRLVIDPDWHTYWRNPGEAGLPTSVTWRLPPGWEAGEFSHPIPAAFLTGELAGYGHKGTALFPVEIKAPTRFEGEVVLKASVTWLACHENACVPGEAALTLLVKAGEHAPTADAPEIERAFARKPAFATGNLRLNVREENEVVQLTVTGESNIDFSAATVYAQTPNHLDPKANIIFQKRMNSWQARVTKSEYATGPIAGLELLVVPPAPHRAFILTE